MREFINCKNDNCNIPSPFDFSLDLYSHFPNSLENERFSPPLSFMICFLRAVHTALLYWRLEVRGGRGERGAGGWRRGAGGGSGEKKWAKNGREENRGKFYAREARAAPRREEGDKGWEGR